MYPPTIADRTWYLRTQFQILRNIDTTHLSQITVVAPRSPSDPEPYQEYIRTGLPSNVNKVPVVTVTRENVGMSYGGFSDVFDLYGESFTHYIFCEDDYFPVQKDLYSILVDEIDRRDTCGYLCMHVGGPPVYRIHAAVPMGIIDSRAARLVKDTFGSLPHGNTSSDYTENEAGQVAFGNSFFSVGLPVEDLRHRFKCWFSLLGGLHNMYDAEADLFVPAQRLEAYRYDDANFPVLNS